MRPLICTSIRVMTQVRVGMSPPFSWGLTPAWEVDVREHHEVCFSVVYHAKDFHYRIGAKVLS